jgi:hypothetical protein
MLNFTLKIFFIIYNLFIFFKIQCLFKELVLEFFKTLKFQTNYRNFLMLIILPTILWLNNCKKNNKFYE